MLRKLAILVLAIGLVGCSTEEEDKQVLVQYINTMTKMADKNKQIVEAIKHLRKPIDQISAKDLADTRALINSYVSDMQTLFRRDLSYRELRVTHNLYVDKVSQAVELSGDKGREMKREKSNVAIGVKHIARYTERHYSGMQILWERNKLSDYPLSWPE
jgi:hypothetical protein